MIGFFIEVIGFAVWIGERAFYGEGGLEVTAGLGQVIGTRVPIFIEDEGVVDGDLWMENHSIVKLSDSLALYDLFTTLSPSLTREAINGILKRAEKTELKSLEAAWAETWAGVSCSTDKNYRKAV
jgi:hypothetical protein